MTLPVCLLLKSKKESKAEGEGEEDKEEEEQAGCAAAAEAKEDDEEDEKPLQAMVSCRDSTRPSAESLFCFLACFSMCSGAFTAAPLFGKECSVHELASMNAIHAHIDAEVSFESLITRRC